MAHRFLQDMNWRRSLLENVWNDKQANAGEDH
jgi:hypothetical protein